MDGAPVLLARAGTGPPVLFVHGWGLGPRAYRRSIEAMAALGCSVIAPALPGFAGTRELVGSDHGFPGYGRWLGSCIDAAGVDEPVLAVGHSFGGGVVTQLAHDFPERVGGLVLLNSVGSRYWLSRRGEEVERLTSERPLWDWGRNLGTDLLSLPELTNVLPAVLEDVVPNLFQNPRALWSVANIIRHADLAPELSELRRRRVPALAVWSDRDRLVSRFGFEHLCSTLGCPGAVVAGSHAWLIADPGALGDVMARAMAEMRLQGTEWFRSSGSSGEVVPRASGSVLSAAHSFARVAGGPW